MVWIVGGAVVVICLVLMGKRIMVVAAKGEQGRVLDELKGAMQETVRARFQAVAAEVGGRIVDGPALETSSGRLVLLASRSPTQLDLDVTKFVSSHPTSKQLLIVPEEDRSKALGTRGLTDAALDDASIAPGRAVLTNDGVWAKATVTRLLVDRIETLDAGVKVKSRLQIAAGKVTILIARGLSEPDELKRFHDGCAAVVDVLRPHLQA